MARRVKTWRKSTRCSRGFASAPSSSAARSPAASRMLAIGRAMMARPRMLMLDEPSLGLSPLMGQEVFKGLRELKRSGLTLLLVEQNALAALKLSDRAYVLEHGRIALEGQSAALASDPRVREAYLGRG